ncbi:unnamed protein product [Gongylonema pulchrum]|uniref:Uncharacterized protein n=1 Tax=Gongylonema pulchrum TaxID=637853 RepID=A0A3P6PIN9_9BILA|nr:unnamed protein product [Gongylonema pulchrum]
MTFGVFLFKFNEFRISFFTSAQFYQIFSGSTKSDISTAKSTGGDTAAAPAGPKLTKSQIESFNRRAKKVGEGLKELTKVASNTKNFDEKLQQDKQRIKDIDMRLKTLSKKEQSLNAELTKQMDVHFRLPSSQINEEHSDSNFYGVCELVDGYQKTVDNLDKAMSKLEQIRKVPAIKSIGSKMPNTPTVDEIDEIIIVMKRFIAKLRIQVSVFP